MMPFSYFVPDYKVKGTIASMDFAVLNQAGIEGVVLDVDNTITRLGSLELDDSVTKVVKQITQEYPCCLLSNYTPLVRRMREITLDIPIVDTNFKKPLISSYREACKLLHLKPKNIAMIGNGIITDIFGANLAGLYTIKVQPLGYNSKMMKMIGNII
jgi:uncharacterized protein